MNILHLLSWFPTPDDPTLGNFCVRMIDALPEDCHSIILSVCDGKDMTKSFEVKEIPGAHLEPDLIHLHVTYPLGQVALLWKKLFGYKYVLTEHWTIYQPQNKDVLVGKLKKKIVKIANNAELIMPVSLDLQRCMEGHGVKNRFKVIYNLVNTDVFRLGGVQTENKKHILHISTLRDEAKNFSGILRTIERLRQQRDDFELHVIHDYDAPEFKAFVKEHNLSDCIKTPTSSCSSPTSRTCPASSWRPLPLVSPCFLLP